jgi:L-iditol 2-dehydrogenase
MRQAVMTRPGSIEIRDIPRPAPGEGEVLLRVKRIGVCGSDIHVWHGLHPYTAYPVVQGHEVSALIEELGPGVDSSKLKVGMPVTFMPQITCGKCYSCRSGAYHICDSLRVMGFQAPGAAQDYFPVAADKIVPLPSGLSEESGAMIEPLSVAVHALRRGGGASAKKVVVVGAGPIGNLVAQVAKAQGAREVLVMDKSAYRLSLALECGVDHAVNASSELLAAAIEKRFGADKADLILECVGAEPTMTQAVTAARKGTTIVVVGVFGVKPLVDLGLVQDRELSLVGTLMYKAEDYADAVKLAASGKMALDRLVTDRYKFEDYAEAYRYIEKAGDKAMKVMIALA